MNIGAWLAKFPRPQSIVVDTAFGENSIDAEVLPDLTDGDLAQLGASASGGSQTPAQGNR